MRSDWFYHNRKLPFKIISSPPSNIVFLRVDLIYVAFNITPKLIQHASSAHKTLAAHVKKCTSLVADCVKFTWIISCLGEPKTPSFLFALYGISCWAGGTTTKTDDMGKGHRSPNVLRCTIHRYRRCAHLHKDRSSNIDHNRNRAMWIMDIRSTVHLVPKEKSLCAGEYWWRLK